MVLASTVPKTKTKTSKKQTTNQGDFFENLFLALPSSKCHQTWTSHQQEYKLAIFSGLFPAFHVFQELQQHLSGIQFTTNNQTITNGSNATKSRLS
jgi:hypothetical protein